MGYSKWLSSGECCERWQHNSWWQTRCCRGPWAGHPKPPATRWHHGGMMPLNTTNIYFLVFYLIWVTSMAWYFHVCRLQETCFVLIRILTLHKSFAFSGPRWEEFIVDSVWWDVIYNHPNRFILVNFWLEFTCLYMLYIFIWKNLKNMLPRLLQSDTIKEDFFVPRSTIHSNYNSHFFLIFYCIKSYIFSSKKLFVK